MENVIEFVKIVKDILCEIIRGVFGLIINKDNKKKNKDCEKEGNEESEYIHNVFILSPEEISRIDDDNEFSEQLATYIGADRSRDQIKIERK